MPMKMKNMKSIDLFCASPASTAICISSMDQKSTTTTSKSKSMHRLLSSKLGDHYKTFNSPCKGISQLPITPRTINHNHNHNHLANSRRKSSADVSDLISGHSSRYLLGDSPFLDSLSPDSLENSTPLPVVRFGRSDKRELRKSSSQTGRLELGSLMVMETDQKKKKKVTSLPLVNPSDNQMVIKSHTNYCDYSLKQKSMGQYYCRNDSPAAPSRNHQVVVLRVSLHCKCKGCEAKLRKHVSKMEGVTSFSIDLENKKVTVIGNVIPLDVLTSISKVKNAQFWQFPTSSSSTSSSSTSSTTDFSY